MKTEMFKTGDRHPEHNMLAFVRYDELGRAEWTSIFRDPSAPYRLAAESESATLHINAPLPALVATDRRLGELCIDDVALDARRNRCLPESFHRS